MTMYIAGEWSGGVPGGGVRQPVDGEVVGVVPVAGARTPSVAVARRSDGARAMRALSAWERAEILRKRRRRARTGVEDLARTIALEVGKPLLEARGEAARIPPLLRTSASEGARMHGETVPVDSAANGAGKLAFTLRQPCGVVVAISPFNYPALLVAHKVGPALAAGNAVVLKPARQTPLTALLLTRTLLEAGLPENAIQCVTGPGAELGRVLCADPRVRKISFTGSTAVGEQITRVAGVKRLSLELGANCPLIVLPDADLDRVAAATAAGGFVNAGQVCISVQRVLVAREVYGDFIERLTRSSLACGPAIRSTNRRASARSSRRVEAMRVEQTIRDAVDAGATLVTGGERDGAVVAPSILGDVDPSLEISRGELFGPAVALTPVSGIEEAIALANDSDYGLGAGLFTWDLESALRFVSGSRLRLDPDQLLAALALRPMPYGGLKGSGGGKEGPARRRSRRWPSWRRSCSIVAECLPVAGRGQLDGGRATEWPVA